ncbi:MAG TPA: hypothetical protein DD735_03135 [Clostridiales bacterium]|nr:hypothetical protein [Clostridiales bacterium]
MARPAKKAVFLRSCANETKKKGIAPLTIYVGGLARCARFETAAAAGIRLMAKKPRLLPRRGFF